VAFLVGEKTFAEDRIRKAIERINSAKGKASQGRLESFFGPAKVVASSTGKRKEAEAAGKKGGKEGGGPAQKKGKLGGLGGKKK
jgi:flap endonuclease-1